MPEPLVEKPKPFPRRGCAVFVALCIAFLGYAMWVGGEGGRHASAFCEAVRPGMTLGQVIGLAEGRWVCQGFLEAGSDAESAREALGITAMPDGSVTLARGTEREVYRNRASVQEKVETLPPEFGKDARYVFTFLGTTPGHWSVAVTFGPDGKAEGVTGPKFWD